MMEDRVDNPYALLRAEAINKNFGAVVALQDVNLQIPRGEITGLVGDNGAGKSTLIKIISGALTPDSGLIEFEGRRGVSAPPPRRAGRASKPSIRISRSLGISRYGRTFILVAS